MLVCGITVAWALPTRIRPLSRPAGEGWGEGGSCHLCCISASHPHPNFPPLDGGRDQVAVTERGRLKKLSQSFQTTSLHSDTLNPLSLQYDRIRGQSPCYAVESIQSWWKAHSGIFCVGLRDNNRSVGFARENPSSPVRLERIGESVALAPYTVYLQATPILTFPRRTGGRDKVAVAEKRSSEKPISSFSDDLSSIFQTLSKSAFAALTHSSDTHNKPVRR